VPEIDVRRAADRFTTAADGLDSRHSFSFGEHYDPGNVGHGLLVAHNEEVVLPGAGFDAHPHNDLEIVTWVLGGSLLHQDSAGHRGVVYPGLAQRMSAGTGVVHVERNDSLSGEPPAEPVHFVQMWVVPDEPGLSPGYDQREVTDELVGGALVPVASGMPAHRAALRINNRHAALHVGRLEPGQPVMLPHAAYLHLFVARGTVDVEGAGPLAERDAVRLTASGGQRVTAVGEGAEILVWEMHAGLRD
jgi:quercetin 2,3-dioxygenase